MAYIGRGIDKLSNIEKLDVITFDGSSSYSLTKGSVAFTPSSANSLQVSIDGVVQAGNFTVSGSTIDFGTAVASTSTNDFIFHYGTGLITTPADGTVGLAQLSATGTKDATTFLRGDNTFAAGGGITEIDQWRISSNLSIPTTEADITTNLERVDTDGFSVLGTGMTESSGIFTFSQTGYYMITVHAQFQGNQSSYNIVRINTTTDNSTYSSAASAIDFTDSTNVRYSGASCNFIFDVTNTSTHKVKFSQQAQGSGVNLQGSTDSNNTHFTFLRLADT